LVGPVASGGLTPTPIDHGVILRTCRSSRGNRSRLDLDRARDL